MSVDFQGPGVSQGPKRAIEQSATGRVSARLACTQLPSPGMVDFDFNPESIVINRSSDTRTEGSTGPNTGNPRGGSESILLKSPASTITISNVYFEGLTTKVKCDTLLNWLSPGGGTLGRAAGMALAVVNVAKFGGKSKSLSNLWEKLPLLTFSWGPPAVGFYYNVVLTNVNISYERFTRAGVPLRAKVTITMKEQPSLLSTLPTNPTSGGLPGRREHLVADGDSLAGIAVTYFGTPSAWRPIAEINDIDDPMRVRPGSRVFIPNPDEFAEEGTP